MKAERKRIAKERIDALFEQASIRPQFAKRYVRLARKIATRYNVRIPARLKRRYCKECNSYLVPGKNCSIRTREGKLIIHCKECKKITRIPLK
ncbi:ribonuclease P [Candidatus Woesearchaeota archaeon]|nr:MAG: ribonuclease P [Candidatus Woesearchaeota archaeon]